MIESLKTKLTIKEEQLAEMQRQYERKSGELKTQMAIFE